MHTFEINGKTYETDEETLAVLRSIIPSAQASGDGSAVQAVMALGLLRGRIVEQVPSYRLSKGRISTVIGRADLEEYLEDGEHLAHPEGLAAWLLAGGYNVSWAWKADRALALEPGEEVTFPNGSTLRRLA